MAYDDQIHIPTNSRATIGAKVLAAVHAVIREEAGVRFSDRREVCGGCTLLALKAALEMGEDYAQDQFEREGGRNDRRSLDDLFRAALMLRV